MRFLRCRTRVPRVPRCLYATGFIGYFYLIIPSSASALPRWWAASIARVASGGNMAAPLVAELLGGTRAWMSSCGGLRDDPAVGAGLDVGRLSTRETEKMVRHLLMGRKRRRQIPLIDPDQSRWSRVAAFHRHACAIAAESTFGERQDRDRILYLADLERIIQTLTKQPANA